MIKKLLLFVVFLISFSYITYAISIGSSLQSPNVIFLHRGESAIFKISIFTLDPNPIILKLETSKPEEITAIVSPNEITLQREITRIPYSCNNCVWIAYGKYFVKAIPVTLYVKLPTKTSTTKYIVKLNGYAFYQNQQISSQGFYQTVTPSFQYTFPLTNISKGTPPIIEETEENKTSEKTTNQIINLPTGFIFLGENKPSNIYWIFILILTLSLLVIVIVIVLIWKKRRKRKYLEIV